MSTNSNSEGRTNKNGPSDNLDEQWAAFLGEHGDDLADVAQSTASKRFAHKAERLDKKREKEAKQHQVEQQFTVNDFSDDIFVQAGRRSYGPRDHTGISWLDDVDDMFTPPNPKLGPIKTSTLLYTVLLVLGVLCLVGAVLLPSFSGILGLVGGLGTLLGAAGFLSVHRGFTQTRRSADDDGARV
ncbi:hypothetical protein GCM10007377_02190 [Galliscardovia ingluviei]|uniref:Membrane associated protein n=1 Tax=Galliscardovia ingluviei TaxID=1769422 RepID=A0A8J3AH09_9BIFI|nr:hypothetical protein [Galliscardovia ingluviei]GGI12684.1 hypothetical protein GCM10007377_02190 [Galliscardovia ingluviei]